MELIGKVSAGEGKEAEVWLIKLKGCVAQWKDVSLT